MASLSIAIAKAGNATLDVDLNALPDAMYQMALAEGLKVMLNKRMSKIGSVTKLEGTEREKAHADALAIATENLNEVMAGTLKSRAVATAKKVAGVVMTEARRLAKEVVKNTIRAAGMKVSHVESSEITKAANALIAEDPSYIEQAEAAIAARKAKADPDNESPEAKAAAQAKLELLGGITISEKLVKAADKAKAEKKSQLSAKQAGKVAPRKASEQHAHH